MAPLPDYDFVTHFREEKLFELPPNDRDPNGYNFPVGQRSTVVTASGCDYLRDTEPVVAIHAHGVHRAYPWTMASKPHSIADYVGDVPIAVFF